MGTLVYEYTGVWVQWCMLVLVYRPMSLFPLPTTPAFPISSISLPPLLPPTAPLTSPPCSSAGPPSTAQRRRHTHTGESTLRTPAGRTGRPGHGGAELPLTAHPLISAGPLSESCRQNKEEGGRERGRRERWIEGREGRRKE